MMDINFLQPTYKINMCQLPCEKHMLFKQHVLLICFFNTINKKICVSHMFKGHMSFLYVGCKKFLSLYDVSNKRHVILIDWSFVAYY
jgi:hypothetical protein